MVIFSNLMNSIRWKFNKNLIILARNTFHIVFREQFILKWMQNIRGYYYRGKFVSLIGQFVHPVGGEGMWVIVIFARCEFHFIRKHQGLGNRIQTNDYKWKFFHNPLTTSLKLQQKTSFTPTLRQQNI